MTVMPLHIEASLPLEPFTAALTRVNAWRGRCIETFARSEAAVTECLVTLAAVEQRGARITLPHLSGQRIDALAAAVGKGGPFEAEGSGIAPAIDACRQHTGFRNMLCHGQARVTLDHHGRWTVVLRLVRLKASRAERKVLVLTESEAEELRETVAAAMQKLGSQIGQLRKRIG